MLLGQLLTSTHFLYATSHLISVFTTTDILTPQVFFPTPPRPVDKRQGMATQCNTKSCLYA